MITLTRLVAWLRALQRSAPPDRDPVIVIRRHDPRFDWSCLRGCSDGGWPGIPVGQHADCRLATDHIDGLHVHVFGDRIEVHLDRADPIKTPTEHALEDTGLPAGLLIGGALAVLFAMLGAGRGAILAAPVLGAVVGLMMPARTPQHWELDALLAAARARSC